MSFSYDPALATDRDWVRFLLGDTTDTSAKLTNEEISAVLREEKNKYLAAARCGHLFLERGGAGKVLSKSVDGLSVSYGNPSYSDLKAKIDQWHEHGCWLLLGTKPKAFGML